MRSLFFLFVLCSGLVAAERSEKAAAPQTFVVGVSPFLDKGYKDEVYRSLVRLLVQDLPLNSTVSFYDAFNLQTITDVKIPDARAFDSPKTRANQFASAIGTLKQFLALDHPKPADTLLKFNGALRVPQFYDFLSETLPDTNRPLSLLLIGSPLYQDQKEPGFSMVDGYFPSDGHLQASRDKSIYGVSDLGDSKRPFVLNWAYFGDPWLSDLYQDKVTRFWTLYAQGRGGQLISFTGDLPTAINSFRQGVAVSPEQARRWTVDPDQTKIEMLRVGREVNAVDWIQRDSMVEAAQHAPSAMSGPMKIGIRWKDNIDLDLYASPRPGAETLFFQHLRSPEGFYYKDHRSSPGREYEFIEFENPVDVREVEAFVNFYKGSRPGGPRGEVRIEFENKIYSAPFSIASSQGNRGRSGSSQQEYWTRIPVQEILKLTHRSVAD